MAIEHAETAEKVHVYQEHYAKERIFVRQLASSRYTLAQERRERLRTVPRVFTPPSPSGGTNENWNIMATEQHASQDGLCGWSNNQGLNYEGIRIGYKF